MPRLLRPDNFTPPGRTPWGGCKILGHYKRGLKLDPGQAGTQPIVGESWEISVEPSFPSRLADSDLLLRDVIAADPAAWLGEEVARRHGGQTPLLVKLLDAADNLSVQVHPAEDDPELAEDESGKPECWYVLEADPAVAGVEPGVYLGFREGVERPDVEHCLRAGGRLDELMNFVPVRPGDAFVVDAGTVHAVGAGVTLVEPQLIQPGRSGVTYRYWDWNRRYDENGKPAATGKPRSLHIERSLAVTRWDAGRGAEAVDRCRALPRRIDPIDPGNGHASGQTGALERTLLIDWHGMVIERWAGSGVSRVPAVHTMLAVLCLRGSAELRTEAGALAMTGGQSAVIPACAGAVEVASTDPATELLASRSV